MKGEKGKKVKRIDLSLHELCNSSIERASMSFDSSIEHTI